MEIAAFSITCLVALAHVYFLVLEMFLWKTAFGRKVFRTTPEDAARTAVLAANQGLYNGFLVAGLVWGLYYGVRAGRPILSFFLVCIVVAGLFGAATANKRILFVQAVPALAALVLLRLL